MSKGLASLAQDLTERGIDCVPDAPLAPLTTFKIGGPAGLLARPRSTEEAALCVTLAGRRSVPFFVLGAGSNVLIGDAGYPHLVISTERMNWIAGSGCTLRCGAGAAVPDVAREAARRGLAGMVKICDVPGSVGGGVYMNAGCEGVTLGDLLASVTWVEPDGGVITRARDQVRLGYRSSEFMGTARLLTEVVLKLTPAEDPAALAGAMESICRERAAKFPLEYPSCGSVFQRVDPETAAPWVAQEGKAAYSAGYYLDRAGLKGARRGNAQISTQHANFIVNLGGATAADVLALIDLARRKVKQTFGIELQLEVNLIVAEGRRKPDAA